jgi:hypothetical protein
MRSAVRFGAAVALAIALPAACAEFSALEDPAFGLPDVEVAQPSFAADVQPILTKRCTQGGCHTLGTAQGGLALDRTVAYEELVGVPATTSGGLFQRVEPGNAADSWLLRRIHPDPALRNGLPRMPLAATPLTPNQIATIVNWIDQGALRN